MVTRAVVYGISTARASRSFRAHIREARARLDRIEAAMTGEEEDPGAVVLVDSFRRDVDRWERELRDWLEYFEEEVP